MRSSRPRLTRKTFITPAANPIDKNASVKIGIVSNQLSSRIPTPTPTTTETKSSIPIRMPRPKP
jgi:hypothetical protein